MTSAVAFLKIKVQMFLQGNKPSQRGKLVPPSGIAMLSADRVLS